GSEADEALCFMLAFWTGGDAARIDDLFRRSGLMRPKWEQRQDYRDRTIGKALELQTEFYSPQRPRPMVNSKHEGDEQQDPGVSDPPAGTGYSIILNYFRQHYQPVFRDGLALHSASLGRLVKKEEACFAAGKNLIDRLAGAADAPRNRQ